MNLLQHHQKQTTGSPSSSKKRVWRPLTPEEIARKKNRKVVNQHLKRIGKSSGRDLSLDQNGVSSFSFKKFVIVVECPEENFSMVLFYTKVSHLNPGDNKEAVRKFANLFNIRQSQTSAAASLPEGEEVMTETGTCPCYSPDPAAEICGTKLSIKGEEVNLCFSVPVQGLSYRDMAEHLESFLKTAMLVNRKLQQVKVLPMPQAKSAEDLRESPPPSPTSRLRLWSMDSSASNTSSSQRSIFSSLFTSNASMDTSSSSY